MTDKQIIIDEIKLHGNRKNLTGLKVGKLTCLKPVKTGKNKNSEWLCECECGTQKIINGCDLRRNRTKSCGCDKNDDFLNKNFGKWKVLSKAKSRNEKRYFLCEIRPF